MKNEVIYINYSYRRKYDRYSHCNTGTGCSIYPSKAGGIPRMLSHRKGNNQHRGGGMPRVYIR